MKESIIYLLCLGFGRFLFLGVLVFAEQRLFAKHLVPNKDNGGDHRSFYDELENTMFGS